LMSVSSLLVGNDKVLEFPSGNRMHNMDVHDLGPILPLMTYREFIAEASARHIRIFGRRVTTSFGLIGKPVSVYITPQSGEKVGGFVSHYRGFKLMCSYPQHFVQPLVQKVVSRFGEKYEYVISRVLKILDTVDWKKIKIDDDISRYVVAFVAAYHGESEICSLPYDYGKKNISKKSDELYRILKDNPGKLKRVSLQSLSSKIAIECYGSRVQSYMNWTASLARRFEGEIVREFKKLGSKKYRQKKTDKMVFCPLGLDGTEKLEVAYSRFGFEKPPPDFYVGMQDHLQGT